MYRYSQHVRDGMGVSRAQRRFLSILCLVLAAAVVVLGIMAARSGSFQREYETLLEKRLLNEANQALSQYNSLSRTGGSSTSSVLGKIRQHVYAVQTLEEMDASLNGMESRRIDEAFFNQVSQVLDSFEVKLQTGQASTEQQAALLELLNYLVSVLQ
ncbi:MAG: hypothetical protein IJ461_02525 [Clostridia bacterium]|nr:hypothetical protein [Clostridia bacterium]